MVKAAYLDTGTWAVSNKRNNFGETVASSKQNYNHIPKDIQYLLMLIIFTAEQQYYFGTQMKNFRIIAYCM
jgi:hypothetical protein